MSYEINITTAQMGEINFEGNVIPHSWFKEITNDSNKPDGVAIFLLSEICYWYRPTITRDENTGKLKYFKKYREDLLQKSYADLENCLGFSKRQLEEAFKTLEKHGLARRVLRTIVIDGVKVPNRLFIEINPDIIKEITYRELKKSIISHENSCDTPRKNVTPLTKKRDTYTENTQETSSKNPPPLVPPKIPDKPTLKKKEEEDFSFLEKEGFSNSDIAKLKIYKAEDIKKCVEFTKTQKITKSRVGYILHMLKNPEKFEKEAMPAKKEDDKDKIIEDNKNWIKMTLKRCSKFTDLEQFINLSDNSIMLVYRNGKDVVGFLEKAFKERIESFLRKFERWVPV